MGDLFQPEFDDEGSEDARRPRSTMDGWTTMRLRRRCRCNIWHYKENTRHASAVTRTRATRKANPKRARRPRVSSPFDVPRSRPDLLGRVLEVRDEIRAVFGLFQTSENHLRARNVLLRVQQVVVQGVLAPGDALVLVRRAVRETLRGAGDAAEQAAEVGTLSSDRARVARVSRPSRFALRASRASNPRARASRVASRRASPRPSRDPRVVVVSSAPACVHRPSPRRGTARTWS